MAFLAILTAALVLGCWLCCCRRRLAPAAPAPEKGAEEEEEEKATGGNNDNNNDDNNNNNGLRPFAAVRPMISAEAEGRRSFFIDASKIEEALETEV